MRTYPPCWVFKVFKAQCYPTVLVVPTVNFFRKGNNKSKGKCPTYLYTIQVPTAYREHIIGTKGSREFCTYGKCSQASGEVWLLRVRTPHY